MKTVNHKLKFLESIQFNFIKNRFQWPGKCTASRFHDRTQLKSIFHLNSFMLYKVFISILKWFLVLFLFAFYSGQCAKFFDNNARMLTGRSPKDWEKSAGLGKPLTEPSPRWTANSNLRHNRVLQPPPPLPLLLKNGLSTFLNCVRMSFNAFRKTVLIVSHSLVALWILVVRLPKVKSSILSGWVKEFIRDA